MMEKEGCPFFRRRGTLSSAFLSPSERIRHPVGRRVSNPDLLEAVASRIEAKLEKAERTGEDLEARPVDEEDPADEDERDFSTDEFESDSAVDAGL